ncbi:MAG: AEC family transporter [Planctomycetota bacterium]
MSGPLLSLAVFLAFAAGSTVVGWLYRTRGWGPESVSRQVHWFTVVVLWTATLMLVLWRDPPGVSTAWLLLLEPVALAGPALLVLWLGSRWMKDRSALGVLVIGAGLGNTGLTLGMLVCHAVFDTPTPGLSAQLTEGEAADPGRAARSYAAALVSVMVVSGIAVLYPIAHRLSPESRAGGGALRLVLRSLADVRAMPLAGAAAGVGLGHAGPSYPAWLDAVHAIDVLVFLGGFGAYFGIGARLRVGDLWRRPELHVATTLIRFGLAPLVALVAVMLAWQAPAPPSALLGRVLVVEAAMPLAIQAVVIPNLFGLDARLASALWVLNTLLYCVVLLPVILWLL